MAGILRALWVLGSEGFVVVKLSFSILDVGLAFVTAYRGDYTMVFYAYRLILV